MKNRVTKIVAPIAEEAIEDCLKAAKKYIKDGAEFLELRIDYINYNGYTTEALRTLIKEINFPIIATNRRIEEGGFFKGSEEERINTLCQIADLVDYIDIELESGKENIKKIVDTGVKTIISYHDFEKTPNKEFLEDIIKKEKELGDIAKIATMPKDVFDTVKILNLMENNKNNNLIAISMGKLGSYTRFISKNYNAPFTFASGDLATAPGQIDIKTMKLLLDKL
ncbi:MAG: type I 3-dehydroquinate dehydratase [Methanobacteriaceae archaeon]